MAKKITLQQYDYGIKLILNITKDNLIEPLDGAKVLIKFKDEDTGVSFNRYATITDSAMAEVQYIFTKEDLSIVGSYVTEVETTYANGVRISDFNPFVLVVQEEIHDKTD